MTCRGHSAKAVKLPKYIKRRAATIKDAHMRGAFIRSFIAIMRSELRSARKDAE